MSAKLQLMNQNTIWKLVTDYLRTTVKIRSSYMDLDILLFDDADCLGDEDPISGRIHVDFRLVV